MVHLNVLSTYFPHNLYGRHHVPVKSEQLHLKSCYKKLSTKKALFPELSKIKYLLRKSNYDLVSSLLPIILRRCLVFLGKPCMGLHKTYFVSLTTTSVCAVCGNKSTGFTVSNLYPASANLRQSRAHVDGLQLT